MKPSDEGLLARRRGAINRVEAGSSGSLVPCREGAREGPEPFDLDLSPANGGLPSELAEVPAGERLGPSRHPQVDVEPWGLRA